MLIVITILAGTAVTATILSRIVARGFEDGDHPEDVTVAALMIRSGGIHATGSWVEVTVTNPSGVTALLGLSLQNRSRLPGRTKQYWRGAARGADTVRLSSQHLGAVAPQGTEQFYLWADDAYTDGYLRALVGTAGRLRAHQLPLGRLATINDAWSLPAAPRPVSSMRRRRSRDRRARRAETSLNRCR